MIPYLAEVSALRARERAVQRRRWHEEGIYQGITLSQRFTQGAASAPDVKLVYASTHRPASTTLALAQAASLEIAAGFRELGFGAGDVLVIQVPHWLEGTLAFMAAMHLGMVVVPLVHIYGPAELGFVLRQSKARGLVTPDRWRNIDYAERFRAAGSLPDLERVIVIGDAAFPGPSIAWQELHERGARAAVAPRHPGSADDVCMLLYTSGTTAEPKGALHTHHSLAGKAEVLRIARDRMGYPALGMMPAGHMSGLLSVMRPFFRGADGIYLDQWDAQAAVDLIREHRVGATVCLSLHLNAMLDLAGESGLPSLKEIAMGGASVPPAAIERADAAGITAFRTYGCTEHPALTSGSFEDSLDKRARTDGRIMHGSAMRLEGEDGSLAAANEPGEIVCLGPETFLGYFDSSLDQAAFAPDGAFRTGDVAIQDDEGYVTIVDRKKDIIIRGGENISSKEVEDILVRSGDIIEAAVVGMPDAKYGERLVAVVRVREGSQVDVPALSRMFAEAGVAKQKTPERVVIVTDYPRTAGGKIQKTKLRSDLLRDGEMPGALHVRKDKHVPAA